LSITNNTKYDEQTTQEAVKFPSFNQINVAEKITGSVQLFFLFFGCIYTMKMIAASVGTAILVTVMTRTAETAQQRPEIAHPDMYGANVAFIVIAILSLVGVIISFFIKESKLPEKELKKKGSGAKSLIHLQVIS